MNEQKQREALNAAVAAGPGTGELSDDALGYVIGGVGGSLFDGGARGDVLTGRFAIMLCNLCGWRAAYDGKGDFDAEVMAMDHMAKHPNCPGDFTSVGF